jgi:hypothetical protein
MALREVFVLLGVDVEGTDQLKRVRKETNSTVKAMKALGGLLTVGVVARGLAQFVTDASEANEQANKFAAVFEDSANTISAGVDEVARATGQGRQEIEGMTASIGALVKPALGSAEAAGEVGTTIAGLALDIASFNDVAADEALIALRSGLIGSAEPLQRFGVDVRQAALDAFALENGYGKTTKQMTEGERVLLRQAAILSQLGAQGALGDAAATAGSFSNRLRALRGRLLDVSVQIGRVLLPFAEKLLDGMFKLIELSDDWGRTMKDVATILKALAFAAIPALILKLTLLSSLQQAVILGFIRMKIVAAAAAVKATAAWFAATAPLILIVGLIAGLAALVFLLFDDLKTKGMSTGEALTEMWTTAVEFWKNLFLDFGQFLSDTIEGWLLGIVGFFSDMVAEAKRILGPIIGSGVNAAATAFNEIIGVTPTPAAAGAGGATVNAPSSVSVQVDARGATDPQAVGRAVANGAGAAVTDANQIARAFNRAQ